MRPHASGGHPCTQQLLHRLGGTAAWGRLGPGYSPGGGRAAAAGRCTAATRRPPRRSDLAAVDAHHRRCLLVVVDHHSHTGKGLEARPSPIGHHLFGGGHPGPVVSRDDGQSTLHRLDLLAAGQVGADHHPSAVRPAGGSPPGRSAKPGPAESSSPRQYRHRSQHRLNPTTQNDPECRHTLALSNDAGGYRPPPC